MSKELKKLASVIAKDHGHASATVKDEIYEVLVSLAKISYKRAEDLKAISRLGVTMYKRSKNAKKRAR